jgi:hypothetical protein
MTSLTPFDAYKTFIEYQKLANTENYCIQDGGGKIDGENTYIIVACSCRSIFSTFGISKTPDHESILVNLVKDLKILFRSEFPTLLTSYPPGFLAFLHHTNLHERAVILLSAEGAKIE